MIPPTEPMKKWVSEPILLGDYEDNWIKESDNVQENGVSFTEEVNQPSLVNVTKQRIQLRPKRRPPSRDFVKSRASMDFNISVPEQIKEEDEEEQLTEKTENITDNDVSEKTADLNAVTTPIKQPSPPKPTETNAWKLPPPEPGVMLRKTPSANSKSQEITKDEDFSVKTSEPSEKTVAPTDSLHDEKHKKRHKRFKFHKFKFHRNREGKERKHENKDTNSNLTELNCMSVDSGSRPLGKDTPKRWPHRHRQRPDGDRRRLSWLLALFNKRKASDDNGSDLDASPSHTAPSPNYDNHATSNSNSIGENGTKTNGNAPEIKIEENLMNGTALNHDKEDHNPESVSDLRKKFERISAAF